MMYWEYVMVKKRNINGEIGQELKLHNIVEYLEFGNNDIMHTNTIEKNNFEKVLINLFIASKREKEF